MSRHSKRRSVNGILLLDKPDGITSNAALKKSQWLFNAKKAGHTGSLDPLATGMLPVCFGEATKFSQFLLEADKRYRVTAQLGVTTTTGDSDGEVLEKKNTASVTKAVIKQVLSSFKGESTQIPSMYSAIKHQGQPLYKLARQGITVERAPRPITIYEIEFLEHKDDTFSFDVHCSKGTYVRSLVEDAGKKLGCGAHVIALRRLEVSTFSADRMVAMPTLEQLAAAEDVAAMDALLLPIDSALSQWPTLTLNETTSYYLRRGQAVMLPGAPTSGYVCLVLSTGDFLGVGEVNSDGCVAPKRLVAGSA